MDFFSFPMFLRDERKLTFHSDHSLTLDDAVVHRPAGGAVVLPLLNSLQVLSGCCFLWVTVQCEYQADGALLINTHFSASLSILSFFFFNKYDVIVVIHWCDAASHRSTCYCCNRSRIMWWY